MAEAKCAPPSENLSRLRLGNQYHEFSASRLRVEDKRGLQLLKERSYEAHAEAFALGQIKTGWQPNTLVADGDSDRGTLADYPNPDLAARLACVSMFSRIGDQLVDHQGQRDRLIGCDQDVVLRLDMNCAVRDTVIHVATDLLDITTDVQAFDVVGLIEALVGPRDSVHAEGSSLKLLRRS